MFDEFDEEPRIDLTPLIDVIFMLVIFFVMTMTFSKPVLDLVLPSADNSVVRKKEAELVLNVKSDGSIYHEAFLSRSVLVTKEDLPQFLDEHPDGMLNLMIDEKAPFESFVSIVDVAKHKRGGRFVISTRAAESVK